MFCAVEHLACRIHAGRPGRRFACVVILMKKMLLRTQFLTPFTKRKCCVGNTKANEDFGEAWMFIIALVTLCLKMGITLRSFPRDSAQRRISLESHAKYLAAGGLQLHPIFPLLLLPLLLKLTVLPQTGRVLQGGHGRLPGNW